MRLKLPGGAILRAGDELSVAYRPHAAVLERTKLVTVPPVLLTDPPIPPPLPNPPQTTKQSRARLRRGLFKQFKAGDKGIAKLQKLELIIKIVGGVVGVIATIIGIVLATRK